MIYVQPHDPVKHYPSVSSHAPKNAPMPTTTEDELFKKKVPKKLFSCGDCFKKKKHQHKLTRYDNDDIVAQIAQETIG